MSYALSGPATGMSYSWGDVFSAWVGQTTSQSSPVVAGVIDSGTDRSFARPKYDPYILWVDDGWKFRSALPRTWISVMATDQVDSRATVLVVDSKYGISDWVAEYTAQGCAVLVDYRHPHDGEKFQVMVTRDPYVIARYARQGGNFAVIASYEPLYRNAAGLARAGFNGLGATQQTVTIPLPAWPTWLPIVPLPAQTYEWLTKVIPGAEIPSRADYDEAKAKAEAESKSGSWVVPVIGAVVGVGLIAAVWMISNRRG